MQKSATPVLWGFAVVTTIHLGVTLACAGWPVRTWLAGGTSLRELLKVYTPTQSNLDVAWLVTLQCIVFAVLVGCTTPTQRGISYNGERRPFSRVRTGLVVTFTLSELLLLTKALIIALGADDALWPAPLEHPGQCGLVLLLGATGSAAVMMVAQFVLATSVVQRREVLQDALDGLKQPLLGDIQGSKGPADKKHTPPTITALLRLSFPDVHIITGAFLAGSVAALAQALLPYFTGKIIDAAALESRRSDFDYYTLCLLGAATVCAIFTGIRGGSFTVAMTRLNMRLRQQLFAALLRQEVGFFDTTRTGDITSRLSADTTTVSDQICLNMNVLFRSMTQAAMVLVFMISASWRLTIVTFVLVPFIMVLCKLYGAYYKKLSKKVQTALAEANTVAEEAISSMTTVKAHAAEDGVQAAYDTKLAAFYVLQRKEALAYAVYASTITFLPNSVAAVVLFYGGVLVLSQRMSAGSLVSFMLYHQSLAAAFQNMGDVFSSLSAAVGAADKVLELIHRQPTIQEQGSLIPSHIAGALSLRSVVFHYPARPTIPVLSGLTLDIPPGQVVALVGPSGGGKSSIVKLLERFYVPSEGLIQLDGIDLSLYDRKWLRRQMAIVSQEPVLYARSIRRNICFGVEAEDGVPLEQQPTQQDVEYAARLANAHDFIMSMPEGYDTQCGEKGVQLSGGQKQRIAIARALVRRPAVLLLDEATSALDADSEAVVQDALDRTMQGRTVLVIAHRLSTVQDANCIVVVQHGQVREQGTHEQLLEAGGVYAQLVRRQLAKSSSVMSMQHAARGSRGSSMSLTSIA